MRVFFTVAIIAAFLAGAAHAQTKPVTRYGEEDKDKSATELEAERQAERAYKRSLSNVPEARPADPWGNVRSEPAAKPAPAKRTKSAQPTN